MPGCVRSSSHSVPASSFLSMKRFKRPRQNVVDPTWPFGLFLNVLGHDFTYFVGLGTGHGFGNSPIAGPLDGSSYPTSTANSLLLISFCTGQIIGHP